MHEFFGHVIDSYSREEALHDGTLVDVSEIAKEAGVRYPCAMTHAAFESTVAWTTDDNERTQTYQDQSGRLWDVVWMFSRAAKRGDGDTVVFPLYVVDRETGGEARLRHLKAVVGPGDTLDPVITIMLPDES
jgi:hypothetical protein